MRFLQFKKMENNMQLNKTVKKYLMITFAAISYGAGVSLFIDPNNLAPGGISGLSIVINRLVPISTGVLFLLFNIPIMLLGAWKFGMKFIVSTLYATSIISVFTDIFNQVPPLTQQPLLGALFGESFSL